LKSEKGLAQKKKLKVLSFEGPEKTKKNWVAVAEYQSAKEPQRKRKIQGERGKKKKTKAKVKGIVSRKSKGRFENFALDTGRLKAQIERCHQTKSPNSARWKAHHSHIEGSREKGKTSLSFRKDFRPARNDNL